MIVTIFYVPLVLPLLLPGVEVNAWDIAKSLIVTMLIPIVLGLMYRSHSPEGAGQWAPVMNKASGIALLIMLVTGLGLNLSNIIDLIGSFGFLALVAVCGRLAVDRHAAWGTRSGPSAACWGWARRSATSPPPSWSRA